MASTDQQGPEQGFRFGPRLNLPLVTLCAATSVNIEATMNALRICLERVKFAQCILLTDKPLTSDHPEIEIERIPKLSTSRDYSRFMLKDLAQHIRSPFCLVVQWDGFILDESRWDPSFLEYDYIGAPWPQFGDHHDVGNGGFSLRSRKLLEACRDPAFDARHPEDLAICRINRPLLQDGFGIRFPDTQTAGRFAHERGLGASPSFGFHGIFNLIPAMGTERFWQLYTSLDDPTTAFADYRVLMKQLGRGDYSLSRRWRLTADWLRHLFAR